MEREDIKKYMQEIDEIASDEDEKDFITQQLTAAIAQANWRVDEIKRFYKKCKNIFEFAGMNKKIVYDLLLTDMPLKDGPMKWDALAPKQQPLAMEEMKRNLRDEASKSSMPLAQDVVKKIIQQAIFNHSFERQRQAKAEELANRLRFLEKTMDDSRTADLVVSQASSSSHTPSDPVRGQPHQLTNAFDESTRERERLVDSLPSAQKAKTEKHDPTYSEPRSRSLSPTRKDKDEN